MAHRDDYIAYERLLESTLDADGKVHRDQAVKKFAEELTLDSDRTAEFAQARADQVADNFDRSRQPDIEGGQMSLTEDNYIVLGNSERIAIKKAKADHTRAYKRVVDHNHAVISAAWSARTLHLDRLVDVQDEHKCSLWEAEQILRSR